MAILFAVFCKKSTKKILLGKSPSKFSGKIKIWFGSNSWGLAWISKIHYTTKVFWPHLSFWPYNYGLLGPLRLGILHLSKGGFWSSPLNLMNFLNIPLKYLKLNFRQTKICKIDGIFNLESVFGEWLQCAPAPPPPII